MVEATQADIEEYRYYLLPDEDLRKIYHIGILNINLYKILLSDSRLIVIKRFPKNVVELKFKNIELAEYYTNVEWLRLFFGLGFVGLIILFLISSDFILQRFIDFLPPLEEVLLAGPVLGMRVGTIILLLVLLLGAFYYLGVFVNSLFGRLRIIIYEQAPLDILTPFNREVADIIRTVEAYKGER